MQALFYWHFPYFLWLFTSTAMIVWLEHSTAQSKKKTHSKRDLSSFEFNSLIFLPRNYCYELHNEWNFKYCI
jgi:hypothetical protein